MTIRQLYEWGQENGTLDLPMYAEVHDDTNYMEHRFVNLDDPWKYLRRDEFDDKGFGLDTEKCVLFF